MNDDRAFHAGDQVTRWLDLKKKPENRTRCIEFIYQKIVVHHFIYHVIYRLEVPWLLNLIYNKLGFLLNDGLEFKEIFIYWFFITERSGTIFRTSSLATVPGCTSYSVIND